MTYLNEEEVKGRLVRKCQRYEETLDRIAYGPCDNPVLEAHEALRAEADIESVEEL